MERFNTLTAEMCKGLDPRMFAVNHAGGEKLADTVARMLDPVDTATFHAWNLAKTKFPELHYHGYDEYWLWTKGRSMLQVRLPDGRSNAFEIGPGWIVYCVRGVEHSHAPIEDWSCFECISMVREGVQKGKHLTR
jgi:mannose-6-phosphate isomerase-like protein (cupin superfamily)